MKNLKNLTASTDSKNISVSLFCLALSSACVGEDETKKLKKFADFDRRKHRESWENIAKIHAVLLSS